MDDPTVSPDERERGKAAAADLPMRAMTRMWQMLLKAIEEVMAAPNAMMAAEMAIIRLTHVADLPSPEELIKKLQNDPPPPPLPPSGGGGISGPGELISNSQTQSIGQSSSGGSTSFIKGGIATAIAQMPDDQKLVQFERFEQVLELIRSRRDMKLLYDVETYVRVVKYLPGRLEFQPTNDSPSDLAQRLGQKLQSWTGARWGIILVNEGGGATVAEQKIEARDDLHAKVSLHPLVLATLLAFPNAEIRDVRSLEDMAVDDQILQEIPEEDDDWDPFEDN